MARLGRGQPFPPKVSQPPPSAPAGGNVNGNVAQVTVTAYFGGVAVPQPAVPNVSVAAPVGKPGGGAGQGPAQVTVAPEFQAPNVSTTLGPATVTVTGYFGSVYVEPPVPEKMPFVPGHARIGQAVPGEPGNIPNNSANVSIAPAGVTVTGYLGAVSPGTTEGPGQVTVAPEFQAPSVTTAGVTPPNVAVAGYFGTAFAGVDVLGNVGQVTVVAHYGAANVSTQGPTSMLLDEAGNIILDESGLPIFDEDGPFDVVQAVAPVGVPVTNVNGVTPPTVAVVPPGPQLSFNPYGAGGSTSGWTGFNGTLTATTSPPAGCPFSSAFKYVNNGVTSGAIEASSGSSWAALPTQQYTMSAWVYTSFGSVQIGFDWLNSSHGYLSTSSTVIGVPVNTWTFVTFTGTSNASSAFAYARVGAQSSSGETVYATQIFAWQPDQPGTETITLPGPVSTVAFAANYGSVSVTTPGGVANVNAQAYFGQVQVTTPQPSTPNVSIQGYFGSAVYIPNTYVAGNTAAVTVAAPTGQPGVTLPGPTTGITARAYFGAVSVSTSFAGSVSVAAPVGIPGVSLNPGPAHITVAAPVGTPGTSVTVPTPAIGVAGLTGTVNVTLPMPGGLVNVVAPAGGAGGGASLTPASVEVTSPAGTASVATSLPPAACGVHAPRGIPVTSVNGATAGIIVLAPVSPLVAGLYPQSAQAIMSFYAGAVKRRKVWFGYNMVNTMNTNVENPGET